MRKFKQNQSFILAFLITKMFKKDSTSKICIFNYKEVQKIFDKPNQSFILAFLMTKKLKKDSTSKISILFLF